MSQLDLLLEPYGVTSEDLLVLLVAGAAFLVVLSIWFGLIERNPMERRRRMLAQRRDELKSQMSERSKRRRTRQKENLNLMRQVVDALKLMQSQQTNKLYDRLAQAGIRSRDAVIVFLFSKVAAPLMAGAGSFFLFHFLQVGNLDPQIRLLVILGSIGLGFFLPDLYLSNRASKRRLALQKALPDGLDLLVICAESGLALDTALDRVSRELGNACPDLSEELSLTSIELGFLPERRQALHNLARRTDMPSIRGVVNTLVQTEKYGTPLSNSLRVLANEFRDARMLKAEEKAARLPATLTVPMIVFILPVLFIVLAGPAIISVMDTMG